MMASRTGTFRSSWRFPRPTYATGGHLWGVVEAWEPVPVSGVENAAYYFSTYNAPDKVESSSNRKIMVLGAVDPTE